PVEDRAVLSAADDAAVGEPRRSRGEEGVLELRLHIPLGDPGHRGSRGGLVTLAGDGDRAVHERELFRTMRLAQALEQTPLVLELDAEEIGRASCRERV